VGGVGCSGDESPLARERTRGPKSLRAAVAEREETQVRRWGSLVGRSPGGGRVN